MGKIRVRTLGDEAQEKEEIKAAKKRSEEKKVEKAEQTPAASSMEAQVKTDDKKKKKKTNTRTRGKKYLAAHKKIEKGKLYILKDAVSLLKEVTIAKFDETVELHINTTESLSGDVTLPHGSGKKTRIAIANGNDTKGLEELLKKVEGGTIDFDLLIATPDAMPKLAKVARVLGPKGLMPNPKTGTVTTKPEELAKQYEGGQIHYKTESKSPILHVSVGKVSFGDKKLTENIEKFLSQIPQTKITSVTLKSTMSPGMKIQYTS